MRDLHLFNVVVTVRNRETLKDEKVHLSIGEFGKSHWSNHANYHVVAIDVSFETFQSNDKDELDLYIPWPYVRKNPDHQDF